MRHLVGPHVLLKLPGGIQQGTGFQQSHIDTQIGEHLGDRSAPSAGADYDCVRDRPRPDDLKQVEIMPANVDPGSPPKLEMGTNGKYGSKRSILASRRGTRLRDESRGGTKARSTDGTLRPALTLRPAVQS
jgi:hypothetical protein